MAAEGTVTAGAAASARVPYRISWVDWLTRGIDRVPGPAWVSYALLFVVAVLLVNGIAWAMGLLPPLTFDREATGYVPLGVFMLALVHYLNRVAGAKLAQFRPALDVDESEYRRLHQQLTTLPAREGALAALIGITFVVATYVIETSITPIVRPPPAAFLLLQLVFNIVTSSLLAAVIYHTIHQLRLVSRIHALAPRIDLFDPAPLYAFSHLTARTGVGLVLLIAYSYVIDPRVDPVGGFLTLLVLGLATAAFVLPLEGMHHRMVEEKERLRFEVNQRLKATFQDLHAKVDRGQLADADEMNKTLDSLKLERDAIDSISTWPWERGTLRGFVTLMLVPVVLWLIFRALERFV